jgi:hypothetical protein
MVINYLQDFLSNLGQLNLRFNGSQAVFSDQGQAFVPFMAFQVPEKLALMAWREGEAIEFFDWHRHHLHLNCPT